MSGHGFDSRVSLNLDRALLGVSWETAQRVLAPVVEK